MRLINSHLIIKSNYIQCQIFINHGITFFQRYLLKEATRQIATKYSTLCRYIISSHLSNIQEVTPRSIPPWSRRAAANRDHTTRMSTLWSDLCCSLRIRPHSANFVGLHQTHGPTCTEECFRGKSLCISYIKTMGLRALRNAQFTLHLGPHNTVSVQLCTTDPMFTDFNPER